MAERFPDRSTEALCERIRVIDAWDSLGYRGVGREEHSGENAPKEPKRIRNFRRAWLSACTDAGVPRAHPAWLPAHRGSKLGAASAWLAQPRWAWLGTKRNPFTGGMPLATQFCCAKLVRVDLVWSATAQFRAQPSATRETAERKNAQILCRKSGAEGQN